MLLAATVRREGEALVGLPEADDLVLWDTATGEERRLPNPAGDLAAGRRLAVVEALLVQGAGVVCAVPLGFCTVSHALARAADLRFLPVEAGTPLREVAALTRTGYNWAAGRRNNNNSSSKRAGAW